MKALREFMNEEFDEKLFLALESARDNLKNLILNNDSQFAVKADNLMPAKDLIKAAKKKHEANKSLSLQTIALESYTDELGLGIEELQFIAENINK